MKYHELSYFFHHPHDIKPPVLFENTLFWLGLLFVLFFVIDGLVLLFDNNEQEIKSNNSVEEKHYNNNIKIETKNKLSNNNFKEVNKNNLNNINNNSSYNNQYYYKNIGNVNGIEIKINKRKKRIKK